MSAAAAPPDSKRPRAVILVGNPANPYSRALRIGRTLVEQGYDVEPTSPAGLTESIRTGLSRMGKVIREAGVKAD